MFADVEFWLKNTIAGILVLGAVGSIVAVFLLQVIAGVRNKLLPLPLKVFRRQRVKQAFMMGYAARVMRDDKSGQWLVAYLAFHLARLLVGIGSFLFLALLFTLMLARQDPVAITIGAFLSATCAFLCLYWIYFEFEYVNRTYLWLWRTSMEKAEDAYARRKESQDAGQKKEQG
jgi:hypothetical protein